MFYFAKELTSFLAIPAVREQRRQQSIFDLKGQSLPIGANCSMLSIKHMGQKTGGDKINFSKGNFHS
jgi:hypothetical protein